MKTLKTDNKKQTFRSMRMEKSVENYLSGKSRRAYSLRKDIARGLKDAHVNPCTNDALKRIDGSSCSCREILEKFTDTFNNMLHTGPALVKRASGHPKKHNKKYRNLKKQNEWLLDNVFDIHGNYLFCVSCIIEILNVHASRLHRLRKIKREQTNAAIIRVRKKDVKKEQAHNIVPPLNVQNVLEWWLSLENDSFLDLRDIPKLHQGCGNNRKEQLLSLFLDFIDKNSQPNGRQVGSHGPLFFLSPKFERINAPSKNEACKSDEWKRRSLVYEFNRTLDVGESISNGTAKNWLKQFRPKHAISPLKTDYCPMCAQCQEQKKRAEAIFQRLQENGNSNEEQIREQQTLAESYWLLLEEHKMEAARELKYYRQQADGSRSSYIGIQELLGKKTITKKERWLLQKLKMEMTFTLSLDYQQSKLTPHWGFSAQPGDTYYLRKLSHHIFGIVDHALSKNTVYVTDERVCAKNGDITISLLDHYIQNKIPSWCRHLCLYMDNGPTNKNQFMIQYGIELVQHNHFDTVKFCFLVAGHAKFDPDRLFSRIAHAYNHSDVFITDQLVNLIQNMIEPEGECICINNREVINWKQLLKEKYGPFEELKKFREFLIRRDDHGRVSVFHKECCYDDSNYLRKQLLKIKVAASLDLRKKLDEQSYYAKRMSSQLSKEKLQDLCKMFDRCIDPKLRPEWLPTSKTAAANSSVVIGPPSATLAKRHREELKKKKRKNLRGN